MRPTSMDTPAFKPQKPNPKKVSSQRVIEQLDKVQCLDLPGAGVQDLLVNASKVFLHNAPAKSARNHWGLQKIFVSNKFHIRDLTYVLLEIVKKAFIHYNGEHLEYPLGAVMLVNFFYAYGLYDHIFAVLPLNPILLVAAYMPSKDQSCSKWNFAETLQKIGYPKLPPRFTKS